MDLIDSLVTRNVEFSQTAFDPHLRMMPTLKTIVIGCVDPRVDPARVFGLHQGEAAVVRNVGGRVNHDMIHTLELLQAVSAAGGKPFGSGWHFIVLHHTDCGIISCYRHAHDSLAAYLDVAPKNLDESIVTDPYKSVLQDVATLRALPLVGGGVQVSGVVYDVHKGTTALL